MVGGGFFDSFTAALFFYFYFVVSTDVIINTKSDAVSNLNNKNVTYTCIRLIFFFQFVIGSIGLCMRFTH